MDAEEAALLAEMRAISNQSAPNRFDADEDEPQKDGFGAAMNANGGVADGGFQNNASAPFPQTAHFAPPNTIRSNLPNTFQGDRGGSAEDEELLRELQAISARSGGADRFAGGDDNDDVVDDFNTLPNQRRNSMDTNTGASDISAPARLAVQQPAPKPRTSRNRPGGVPPWKRGKQAQSPKSEMPAPFPNDDVVIAAPPAPTPAPTPMPSGPPQTIKSNLPNTFRGDRGGTAEDEELLRELQAISNRSGGGDRFAGGDDDDDGGMGMQAVATEVPPQNTSVATSAPKPKSRTPRNRAGGVPPWKRGKQAQPPAQQSPFGNVDAMSEDVVVAAPPAPTPAPAPTPTPMPSGPPQTIKSNLPNTFRGDRGGAAEDEELLRELQAISNRSGGGDRFAGGDGDDDGMGMQATATEVPPQNTSVATSAPKPKSRTPRNRAGGVPPWKRGKQAQNQHKDMSTPFPNDDVVIAAPPVPVPAPAPAPGPIAYGPPQTIKSNLPNTFRGDRGGAAEDEELLRELQAISNRSGGGGDRFADDDGAADGFGVATPNTPAHVERSAPELVSEVPAGPPRTIKSDLPQTFKGDRGGAAEDEDLLRELQAISSRSGGGDRFVGGDDEAGMDAVVTDSNFAARPSPTETSRPKPKQRTPRGRPGGVPPWKRGKQTQTQAQAQHSPFENVDAMNEDVVIAAPPAPVPSGPPRTMKSDLPQTFKGDRGGVAEDEELLRELQAISAKSGGTDRFAGGDDANGIGGAMDATLSAPPAARAASKPTRRSQNTQSRGVPPWKRGKQQQMQQTGNSDDVMAAAPTMRPAATAPPPNTIKSDLPQTFKGDRGGAAEDEELLRELQAISNRGGMARFDDSNSPPDNYEHEQTLGHGLGQQAQPRPQQQQQQQQHSSQPLGQSMMGIGGSTQSTPPLQAESEDEIVVTRDTVSSMLVDKKWKIRKAAYGYVAAAMKGTGEDPASVGSLISEVGGQLSALLMDKNASALESCLDMTLVYVNTSADALPLEQAAKITQSLVKGTAFGSSRPATIKCSDEIAMKLIEFAEDGASIKAVAQAVLDHGLTSRKPKVVLQSATLVLNAAKAFGAACLPLASITTSLPKLLSNTNKKVRDVAVDTVVEFCRAFGSKAPMEGVIGKMQKSQAKHVDSQLASQPSAAPPTRTLRYMQQNGQAGGAPASAADALAALEAGAKELEMERLAKRPAVNLMATLPKTDYSAKLQLAKWSEKVGALDIALQTGGDKPYKLTPPSSNSNYAPLISDMKGLLSHTHFAVCSKAMQVLSMLAEGVGDKLFPNLRPLIGKLLSLAKDKKLTKPSGQCLDSLFGKVLSIDHVVDQDALPDAVNEKKQKNALARTAALDFLNRCVSRAENAGPRGVLSVGAADKCAKLGVMKLEDSDASVRKAAMGVLQSLQSANAEGVRNVVNGIIDTLQAKNARAYKSLMKTKMQEGQSQGQGQGQGNGKSSAQASKPNTSKGTQSRAPGPPKPANATTRGAPPKRTQPSATTARPQSRAPTAKPPRPAAVPVATSLQTGASTASSAGPVAESMDDLPDGDQAMQHCEDLNIPNWSAEDDEGGVLAGLQASKWAFRKGAIDSFAAFITSSDYSSDPNKLPSDTAAIFTLARNHTKDFKDTNVNIMKAIMQLFIAAIDQHYEHRRVFSETLTKDAVRIAVPKIADKKLMATSKELLTKLCTVQQPSSILTGSFSSIDGVRAPLPHEELLKWFASFCGDFGSGTIGGAMNDTVEWLVKEGKSSNLKIKRAAQSAFAIMFVHLGPAFEAIAMSATTDQGLKDQLGQTFSKADFDPSLASQPWPKSSLAHGVGRNGGGVGDGSDGAGDTGSPGLTLELPKFDLVASLPKDCMKRMALKDSKTAWKQRKAALEEVEKSLKNCNGLIDTAHPKGVADILKGMKERLSDSQSNLRPLAVRLIGSLLGKIDAVMQGKLGRVVYGAVLSGAMNDGKKTMHDASMKALKDATSKPAIVGGGINEMSVEPFVVSLVGELAESKFQSNGIADVLRMTSEMASSIPSLDAIASQGGLTLGERFSQVVIESLMSSKSDVRAAGEALLSACVENRCISIEGLKKALGRMKPAKQRSVAPIITKLSKKAASHVGDEDEAPSPSPSPSAAAQGSPKKTFASRLSAAKRSSVLPTGNGTGTGTGTGAIGNERPHANTRRRASLGTKGSAGTDETPTDDSTGAHPLDGSPGSAGVQRSRAALRMLTWPEYPEESSGSSLFNGLKKSWVPLLPAASTPILFPSGGFRKQDDAKAGCELLSKAVDLERTGEGEPMIMNQIGIILKWITFVLCTKESTVGLQALLTFLSSLFDFLREQSYEFSDFDVISVVPFLFDKASAAKGRFKDTYNDLLAQIKHESLLPTKKLGPLVCVGLIESSVHAKARLQACKDCSSCVEKIGLSGIGKKGVLVVSKSLSEEKLPDNRHALLDLVIILLSRMNDDMQRFARICGPNLSDKARNLIEEQLKKASTTSAHAAADTSRPASKMSKPSRPLGGASVAGGSGMASTTAASSTRRVSRLAAPPATASKIAKTNIARPVQRSPEKQQFKDGATGSFGDELPSLDLRFSKRGTGIPRASPRASPRARHRDDQDYELTGAAAPVPAAFDSHHESAPEGYRGGVDSKANAAMGGQSHNDHHGIGHSTPDRATAQLSNPASWDSETRTSRTGVLVSTLDSLKSNLMPSGTARVSAKATLAASKGNMPPEAAGAAASLRARLLKIRERNKTAPPIPRSEHKQSTETPSQPPTHNDPNGGSLATSGGASDGGALQREAGHASSMHPNITDNVQDAMTGDGSDLVSEGQHASYAVYHGYNRTLFDDVMASINRLVQKETPLAEDDDDLVSCTESLKAIHAAISSQPNLVSNVDSQEIAYLRDAIIVNTNDTVAGLTSLIDFGFQCHQHVCSAGMSVPLLSVDLACLMAIFRAEDTSKQVHQDQLAMLIREAGKALLDPRLASPSQLTDVERLDDATSTQLVRAINKLAVQAATGSTRDSSIQALLSLQVQLRLHPSEDNTNVVFNSRLSRVVSKLFARVIKAEESASIPFSSLAVDMETVLCCLEDTLARCDKVEMDPAFADGVAAVTQNIKTLLVAILQAKGGTVTLKSSMEDVGIDPVTSSLGRLMSNCAAELNMAPPPAPSPRAGGARTPSVDIATLVSAVGSAAAGAERDEAVGALRRYKEVHGEIELTAHLQGVSSAFRQFILDQLSNAPQQGTSSGDGASKHTAGSMSERLKNLRSKLSATEAVMQSTAEPEPTLSQPQFQIQAQQQSFPSPSSGMNQASPLSRVPSAPSPPVPQQAPASGEDAPNRTLRAFRERLAAAQERRTGGFATAGGDSASNPPEESEVMRDPTDSDMRSAAIPAPTATGGAMNASSRAAALRARIQAVKQSNPNP